MTNQPYRPRRLRVAYLAIFFLSLYIGFSTRWYPDYWPPLAQEYGADFFSGWMAIGFFGFFFPRLTVRDMAVLCITGLFIDEFTQAYHEPTLDKIRDTFWGGVFLGHGFVWTDLVCYFLGVVSGSFLEGLWFGHRQRKVVRTA